MLTNINAYLERVIKWLLLTTALIPLTFSSKFLYPYIVPKTFFAKGLIQIILALTLILFLWMFFSEKNKLRLFFQVFKEKIKNAPKSLFVFGGLFVLSQALSAIFAEFPYRAFWGTLERGGGFFNFLHFVLLFALIIIFFRKEDFARYFKFSVAVGLIIYFYAFLQAIGFTQFPFTFAPDLRPGSFLGNAAFLAAYSFFVMVASVITAWFSKERKTNLQKFWFSFSIVAVAITPIIIFLTRTRGAIIGLGISVVLTLLYFIFKNKPSSMDALRIPSNAQQQTKINFRITSIFILAVLVVFGATLFLTRNASIWQKIPGIDRLVQSSGPGGGSTQVRLLSWKLAINAFLEKPVFGWGPEHYLVAFERRYDPEFSTYGEFWLDRAHNSILDVAATQGTIGLVGYLGFLVGLFWFFFRAGPNFNLRFFVGAIFLGFTAQNLFLLEEFHAFAPFFVLVGAIVTGVFSEDKTNNKPDDSEPTTHNPELTNNKQILIVGGSVLVSVVALFSIYKTVLVPTTQAYYAHKMEIVKNKEEFFNFFDKATKPYSFAEYSIRSYLHDFFYTNQPTVFTDPNLADLGNKLVDSIRDVLEREGPYDIRLHIRLSQAYQEMAKQTPGIKDPVSYYREGEKILREALEISPFKQELIYGLGFALAGEGRYEEAILLMEKSIASNPHSSRISRLHYYYGLILSAAGRGEEAFRAFEDARRADPQLTSFSQNDIRGLFSVYESLGEYSRIIDIVTESAKSQVQVKIDLQYYEVALPYYIYQQNGENIIVIAQFIAKNFPERKEDMEAIIGLVKNKKWEILNNL